jgi:hypothetical protein
VSSSEIISAGRVQSRTIRTAVSCRRDDGGGNRVDDELRVISFGAEDDDAGGVEEGRADGEEAAAAERERGKRSRREECELGGV